MLVALFAGRAARQIQWQGDQQARLIAAYILGARSLLKKTDKQRDPRDYTSYVHAHQPHEGAAGA